MVFRRKPFIPCLLVLSLLFLAFIMLNNIWQRDLEILSEMLKNLIRTFKTSSTQTQIGVLDKTIHGHFSICSTFFACKFVISIKLFKKLFPSFRIINFQEPAKNSPNKPNLPM